MGIITVYGIDPGRVDTGIVRLGFSPGSRTLHISNSVLKGMDGEAVSRAIGRDRSHIFIEGYKPRSHFGHDKEMVEGVKEIHTALPGSKVLLNHGVKKVITDDMLQLLYMLHYAHTTHHQDLRSAGRIALFGMVKDPTLNALLYDVITSDLDNMPWQIIR